MSDSLSPLRQVYDLGEPPPGRPDGAAAVEGEMLAQMRRLLDAAPRSRPDSAALGAIDARAEAALPFAALRSADAVGDPLLQQSIAALDTLPVQTPDTSALDAVLARAAHASAELAPIRTAYAQGDSALAGDPVETELLTGARRVLDRVRTAQRPSPEAVDAVLARAASWTAESVGRTTAPSVAAAYGLGAPLETPEAAIVSGSVEALGRLPLHRPSDDALAAVLAAAATATASAAVPTTGPRPSAPARTAVAGATGAGATALPAALWARRPVLWGGALATMLAVLVVVGLSREGETETAGVQTEIAAAVTEAAQPEADAVADRAPLPPLADPVPQPSAGAQSLAAGGPMAGLPAQASALAPPVAALAVVPTRQTAPAAPRREAAPALRSRLASVSSAPAAETVDLASAAPAKATSGETSDAWDAADDVRLLSLRLQELRRKNQGLTWDAPAEPFGAPGTSALSATPGLQSVGVGSSAVPRARALVDTTTDR